MIKIKNFDSLSNENINAKNKLSHFITVNCYTKISPETANKILLEIPKKVNGCLIKKQIAIKIKEKCSESLHSTKKY